MVDPISAAHRSAGTREVLANGGIARTLTVAIAPDNAIAPSPRWLGAVSHQMERTVSDNPGLLDGHEDDGRGVGDDFAGRRPVGGLDNRAGYAVRSKQRVGSAIHDWQSGQAIFDRYDYLHVKMIIVDGHVAVIGSENLSPRSLTYDNPSDGTRGHRGVYLVTDASGVISRALEIWNADFDPPHHRDLYRWSITDTKYGPPPIGFTPNYSIEVSGYRIAIPRRDCHGPADLRVVDRAGKALRTSDVCWD
jgi:phosphatidylserine/phosphatidylglycerophosphate/cardiolipin synthase-like enzyme